MKKHTFTKKSNPGYWIKNETKPKPMIFRVSGGRTSMFMARFCQLHENLKHFEKYYIFANTSDELPATYEFIKRCDDEWGLGISYLEADLPPEKGRGPIPRVVKFEDLKRNRELLEEVIQKHGLYSKIGRYCTRDLKQTVMDKYSRQIAGYDYIAMIGIRADEAHRAKPDRRMQFGNHEVTVGYPLIDMVRADEKFIVDWWKRQPFDLGIPSWQGNCSTCFLRSIRKRIEMVRLYPDIAEWGAKMEDKHGTERQPKFDRLLNLTWSEIKEMAGKKELAEAAQLTLNFDFDREYGCFCKST